MGNPMFDLANFSMNQNLDTEGDQILIESYFGKVSQVELAEINLWKIVAIFIEGVWGILQAKISQFDRDYQGFSNENWQIVRQYMQKESFSQWLSMVSLSNN
jgi:thiamine kinase-like enzyme